MESLHEKVVVITGASGGLGRELAVRFACVGAHVVLAARREAQLEQTAIACREAGGFAMCVVTDVTREEDVERLAVAALRINGRIDVWINNAGVTLFAPIEIGAFAEHRRVIETNLFGPMFAARAVLPIFRLQHSGVMINVGSVLSEIGQPFVPAYVISKFALRGLSEALRVEIADYPDVHVCTVYPYAMDTPHFQHGGNRVGFRARAMAPAQAPERVASAVLDLVRHPRREVHVPHVSALVSVLHALAPRTTESLILHALQMWHFEPVAEPCSPGNLFEPTPTTWRLDAERDGVHGQRGPRVSAPGLLLWIGLDLVAAPTRRFLRRVHRAVSPRSSVEVAA